MRFSFLLLLLLVMDPPRQISRRGPGSGPVFRNFKKGSSQSIKIPPQPSTASLSKSDSSVVLVHLNADPVQVVKRIRVKLRSGTERRKHISTIDNDTKMEISTSENTSSPHARASKVAKDSSISPSKKEAGLVSLKVEKNVSENLRRSSSRQRSRIKKQSSVESEKVTQVHLCNTLLKYSFAHICMFSFVVRCTTQSLYYILTFVKLHFIHILILVRSASLIPEVIMVYANLLRFF